VVFPSKIRSGDLIQWRDPATNDVYGNPISSPDWTVIYYLRTNKSRIGATITSSAYGDGFQFSIPSATSADFVDGDWFFQAVANKSGNEIQTIGTGTFKVLPSLAYTGSNPKAFDGRTDTEKTLDLIKTAIDNIMKGGAIQEYKIGTRTAKKYTLEELEMLKGRYIGMVNLEKQAELMANGLGNPRAMYVRFK
tara:strand:- start:767 stop:1345 length:579 start_codon:yes stop_codon:yes gene_type:complete